jgi:hypothetical protein
MTLSPGERDHLDDLLAKLAAADVRLSLRGIRIVVDAPNEALTPDLIDSIKEHHAVLQEHLRLHGPCSRCCSEDYIDVPIHDGRSMRRDCACCHQTKGFSVWNPSPALPTEPG